MAEMTADRIKKLADSADENRKSYRRRMVEELQKDTQLSYIVNSYARSLAEAEAEFEIWVTAARVVDARDAGESEEKLLECAVKYARREAFRRLTQQPGSYAWSQGIVDADRVAAESVLRELGEIN